MRTAPQIQNGSLSRLKHFSIIKMKHINIIPTQIKVKWVTGTYFVSKLNDQQNSYRKIHFYSNCILDSELFEHVLTAYTPEYHCHCDLLCQGDAGKRNSVTPSYRRKENLIPVFSIKLVFLAFFLKNVVRRSEAKLL